MRRAVRQLGRFNREEVPVWGPPTEDPFRLARFVEAYGKDRDTVLALLAKSESMGNWAEGRGSTRMRMLFPIPPNLDERGRERNYQSTLLCNPPPCELEYHDAFRAFLALPPSPDGAVHLRRDYLALTDAVRARLVSGKGRENTVALLGLSGSRRFLVSVVTMMRVAEGVDDEVVRAMGHVREICAVYDLRKDKASPW